MNVKFFPGYKTYFIAFLMIAYAGIGFYIHQMTQEQATTLAMQGFAFAFLRAGVSKLQQ